MAEGVRESPGARRGSGEIVRDKSNRAFAPGRQDKTASFAHEGLGGIISKRVCNNALKVLLDA